VESAAEYARVTGWSQGPRPRPSRNRARSRLPAGRGPGGGARPDQTAAETWAVLSIWPPPDRRLCRGRAG